MKKFEEPELIKAGDTRLKLGINSKPPLVDCRVFAEANYQDLMAELERLKSFEKAMADLLKWAMEEQNDRESRSMLYSALLFKDVADQGMNLLGVKISL